MGYCDNWDKECSRVVQHAGCIRPLGTSCPPKGTSIYSWFGVARHDFFKEFGVSKATVGFYHDNVAGLEPVDRKIVIARLRRRMAA